jgi:hypothetical protein
MCERGEGESACSCPGGPATEQDGDLEYLAGVPRGWGSWAHQRGALMREMRWLALVVAEKCWYKNTLRCNKCHGSRIRQTSEIDRVGVMGGGTYLGFQEIRCG